MLPTAVVLALLAATTVAFVATEHAKLRPSPITKVSVTKIFSPTCECDESVAAVAFRLRQARRVAVTIVDSDDRLVRTLVGPVNEPRGPVTVEWDGRTETGDLAPDGRYRVRVQIGRRKIDLPTPVNLDATAPVVRLVSVRPTALRAGRPLRVRYRLNEPARVSVFLNGKRAVVGNSLRRKWKLQWSPHLRPGRYRVTITARDPAGNVSAASSAATVVAAPS